MAWLTVALLLVAQLAYAEFKHDFGTGYLAYFKGDYATALRHLKPFAQQGDAKAQNNLGVMYDKGEGVPQASQEQFLYI